MRPFFLRAILLVFLSGSTAVNLLAQQAHYTLKGHVADENGKAIELAQVILNDALQANTDKNGNYVITGVPAGEYTYHAIFVGYQGVTGTVKVTGNQSLNITMQELGLKLKNVTVTANQVQMGSKSEIGQEAIRHLQPKSLNDLLQLVPGNLTENPNLNNLAQAQIREIDYDNNNAFGTQVIVDGTPLSNDGNMQTISPTMYASRSSSTQDGMADQTTAGKGVDLRTVSAGVIEAVDVIRGIPSVEYGNLTSGVVVVKTKSGYTPWEAKFQADPNSKLAFASKGFSLHSGGAVNFSLDWAQSWADTRQHYKGYDRVTATAGYSNQWGALSFNAKGAFFTTLNNLKEDPQMQEHRTHYKNRNTGIRLSLNGDYKPKGTFLTSLSYDLSLQASQTIDKKDTWVSNYDVVVCNARESGISVGRIQNASYQSFYQIDSKPLNFFSQLIANKYLQFNNTDFTAIKLGAEYSYDVNNGKGVTYDEKNPPQAQGTQTLRPRAYSAIPGIGNLSGFLSDKLSVGLPAEMRARAEIGVRLNNLFVDSKMSGGHNNITVLEPRVNASLNILNAKNNNFLDNLSLTGGYGISHKMPSLLYLYPDYAYFDNISLARIATNTTNPNEDPNCLALVTTDVVKNTQNKYLKPMRSRKWEIGFSFAKNKIRGFVTYFNEHNQHEYGFQSYLTWQDYYKYDIPIGATDLSFNPSSNDVSYIYNGMPGIAAKAMNTEMFTWYQPSNNTHSRKYGIEYGLDLGEFKPLKTSLSINGAWFHVKRLRETEALNYINFTYDYVGLLPNGAGDVRDRVNTTFRLITHIPVIKMILTTAVQVVWYESAQSVWEDSNGNSRFYLKSFDDKDYLVVNPVGYYDKQRVYHPWQDSDVNNAALLRLASRSQPYNYSKDVIEPWAMLNLRFTKELGKIGELSFIANNFTNTKRWHTNKYSLYKSQIFPSMYYGAELKLKF